MASEFEFKYIKKYIENIEKLVIFDIGANNFEDSTRFKKHFPNAVVYAFEPLKSIAKKCSCDDINIIYSAVSDIDGEITFYPSQTYGGKHWDGSGSICRPRTKPNTNELIGYENLTFNLDGIIVPSTRLDTFCNKNNLHPNVLHIDIQGAEQQALSSLGELRPKIIFAETCVFNIYETNTTKKDFNKFMNNLGYRIEKIYGHDTLYILN